VLDRNRVLHEVTTFRRDVSTDGRRAVVEWGVSLDDDLARRDFTVNAIAYHPLRKQWHDPFGGRRDFAMKTLRAVGNPGERFREDYLRILRLVRFAARLEFAVDPATWTAACAAAGGLPGLSAERVRDEWFKSLRTARNLETLVRLWHDTGAAAAWLPELATPRAAAALHVPPPGAGRDPVLLTAALCRDAAAVLLRLRGSRAEVERAAAVGAPPMAPADPRDERAVRRWLAAASGAADDLLALRRLIDGTPAPWAECASAIRERGDPITRGDLAVSGRDLLEAGVPPGPAVGEALERLLDRVLDDPTLNRKDTLLALARGAR
jgi:tRNA nucleotidyltransferase (CCA-adding enzyme)